MDIMGIIHMNIMNIMDIDSICVPWQQGHHGLLQLLLLVLIVNHYTMFYFHTGARHGFLHRLLQQQHALAIVQHPMVGWHMERRWGRPVGRHWGPRQRLLGRSWPLGAALSAQARRLRAHDRVRHEVRDVAIAQTSPEVHDVHDVRDVQTYLLWCTYLRD